MSSGTNGNKRNRKKSHKQQRSDAKKPKGRKEKQRKMKSEKKKKKPLKQSRLSAWSMRAAPPSPPSPVRCDVADVEGGRKQTSCSDPQCQRLDTLLQGYAADAPPIVFDDFSQPSVMWRTLEETGVFVVRNVVCPDALRRAKERVAHVLRIMAFGYEDQGVPKHAFAQAKAKVQQQGHPDPHVRAYDAFRNTQYGFGNASFGYLFLQFVAQEHQLRTKVAGVPTVFNTCPAFARVNMALLQEHPDMAAFLQAQPVPHGIPHQRVFSVDSAKVATYAAPLPSVATPHRQGCKDRSKMTRQVLTPWHQDVYESGGLHRTQAIVVHEGANALGFVPFGHRADVRALMGRIKAGGTGKAGARQGYVTLGSHPGLVQVMQRHWISTPPGSLVVWASGVPHASAVRCLTRPPIAAPDFRAGLYPMQDSDSVAAKPVPNEAAYRFIVGTQCHLDPLSQADVNQLAVLALFDFVPEYYKHINRDTPVRRSMVCCKSTMWRVPRALKPGERERWQLALDFWHELQAGRLSLLPWARERLGFMGYCDTMQ